MKKSKEATTPKQKRGIFAAFKNLDYDDDSVTLMSESLKASQMAQLNQLATQAGQSHPFNSTTTGDLVVGPGTTKTNLGNYPYTASGSAFTNTWSPSYAELAKDFDIELTDTEIRRLDELKDSGDADNKTIAATIFKSKIMQQMKKEWEQYDK